MRSSDEFSRSLESIAERVRVTPEERASLETSPTDSKERSVAELQRIREELHTLYTTNESAPTTLVSPTPPSASTDYLSFVSDEYRDRVSSLIDHATAEGILSAIAEVQKTNDPYLIDSFHDAFSAFLHTKMRDANLL